MAKNEQVRIDLVAQDKASDVIDDVADAAGKLEKLEPEIEITADGDKAERQIEDVSDDVRALSRQDAEIVLKARADQANAELKDLRSEMERTGDKARETQRQLDDVTGKAGPGNFRGNAIADLTGPLGDASSAASDFAGVFDGLGDAAESAAGKIGLSQDAAGQLSSVVSGLGVAVAAGAAAWTYFRQRAEKAREEQRKLVEGQRNLNEALREGDIERAAQTFVDAYGDIGEAARSSGLFMEEFTRFVTGQQDALPEWEANIEAVRATMAEGSTELHIFDNNIRMQTESVYKARDSYIEANGAIREQDQALEDVSGALKGASSNTDRFGKATDTAREKVDRIGDALDDLQGQLDFEQATLNFQTSFGEAAAKAQEGIALTAQETLDLKNDYLTVAREIGLNPVQIKSDLDRITAGDANDVFWDTQAKINAKGPVVIKASISLIAGALGAAIGAAAASGGQRSAPAAAAPAAATVVNVTQNIPRGWRGDVLGEAQNAARRSGGLYRKARR